jgi:hypothetical protein
MGFPFIGGSCFSLIFIRLQFFRLSELESEKKLWSDGLLSNPNVRKGTALFALLLVMTVNFVPLRSNIYL